MPPHPLTNLEIQKYFQKKPRFNVADSRSNLSKIEDGACVINLGEYKLIETYWIALYESGDNMTYFDSSGVEHFPKEIKKLIGNTNITRNIFRVQAYDSIMCGYSCIGFFDFMLKGKSLSISIYFLQANMEKMNK